jgi:hypothetical protein
MKLIKLTCFLAVVLVFVLFSCSKKEQTSHLKYHRTIPYPESELIEKFEFTSQPSRYLGD